MKNTNQQKTAPVIETQNDGPAIEAFQAFEWIYDLPADATVPAQQLARFANHVLDVTKGAALVFELIAANEFDSLCDQASYLTPNHLGTLRRLATCSLSSLERHAEEIAEGFRATAEKP